MTTTTNKRTQLDPNEIPEVVEYLAAEETYEAVKEKHRKALEELIMAANERNACLEAADKAVRALEVSCGPFQLLGRPTEKIDAEALYEELGKDGFLAAGGKIETQTVYVVDVAKFHRLVSSGEIPQEILDAVTTRTCRFRKPDKVILP